MQTNIYGEMLENCSKAPLSGFYRDGMCRTSPQDFGNHSVCAIVTDEFLIFSKKAGNDLITPMPEFHFAGLKAGDRWCLCATRWLEAYHAGVAPQVYAKATSNKALEIIDMEILKPYCM
ncbi:MAG: DUF2237 domain-containing protein [Sulfurospirillum sp.]|nr:DUF2237 domain-containing protein [Sulfurospirillum sp.]